LEIVDLSLTGILESLATKAWSKPCHDSAGIFLLSPLGLATDSSPDGLWQALRRIYEHARSWAPGLDVPWFVPPVRIIELKVNARHFAIDEESYASIAVSSEFLGSSDATCLILAHEACHHILLQSGISYQYRSDVIFSERLTDLTMFVCGFGEVVRRGHSIVSRSRGHYVSTHLGYLRSDEYEAAYRYVLAKRVADHLPGAPERTSVFTKVRKQLSRLGTPFMGTTPGSRLLEKVIKETERKKRRRD
jgi:hypothetical protein